MTKANEAPVIIPIMNGGNKISISTTPISYNHHDVFIDSEITEPSEYRDLVLLLFNASESDEINLFLNSGGGSLDTALAIIEGLKHTQAKVTGVILGACHSAASIIALHCQEVVVLDSSYLMVHTANFGALGNTSNVKAHVDFTVQQIHKLLHSTYDGFLSADEIEKVKTGTEFWFDAEEIKKRLGKKATFAEKALKSEQAKAKRKAKQTKPEVEQTTS